MQNKSDNEIEEKKIYNVLASVIDRVRDIWHWTWTQYAVHFNFFIILQASTTRAFANQTSFPISFKRQVTLAEKLLSAVVESRDTLSSSSSQLKILKCVTYAVVVV